MHEIFTTKLAGVSFGKCQENIKNYGCPEYGIYDIVREPNNPHDQNAVRVITLKNHFMGYLPKKVAAKISRMMAAGRIFVGEFVRVNDFPEVTNTVGLTVRIVEITR